MAHEQVAETAVQKRLYKLPSPVDDVVPYFQAAALGVAPLTSASGMKVKVLQYASYGLPVVGTLMNRRGLNSLLHLKKRGVKY